MVELEIIDAALSPMLLAPMSMFLSAGFSERSGEDFRQSTRVGEYPALEESHRDFIARQSGKEGQVWLREVSKAANFGADAFLPKVREVTEQVFGLQGQDALRVLEQRWEDYLKQSYGVTGV